MWSRAAKMTWHFNPSWLRARSELGARDKKNKSKVPSGQNLKEGRDAPKVTGTTDGTGQATVSVPEPPTLTLRVPWAKACSSPQDAPSAT